MSSPAPAPVFGRSQMLRNVDAVGERLGRLPTKLVDAVQQVIELTRGAPYAVVGGLAQILWARKTHTDDLDIVLAARDLLPPLPPHEGNDVFDVCHLLLPDAAVDLLAYRDEAFSAEILVTAMPVPGLRNTRFICPELLLVTQLLRPGMKAELAATELTLARRAAGDFDLAYVERWAAQVGCTEALRRTFARADEEERHA